MNRSLILLVIAILTSWPSLLAQAQATYTLKATPKTVAWGYYVPKTAPLLRVKSGDTVEIQTPIASTASSDEKRPLIYVKHLEPPYYPPLARVTRIQGTVVMMLKLGADGKVLTIEESSDPMKRVSTILRNDAEKNVKTWTFGCVGCAPGASFEHTIKFNYILDDNAALNRSKVVMDLPDEATMSIGPIPINASATSKKGSH